MDYFLNFLKGGAANDGIPLAEFTKFSGHGHFYQLKNGKPETIFKQANVKFKVGDEEFCYYLIIENTQRRARNRSNKENVNTESSFRISERFKLMNQYEKRNSEDIMLFEWIYEDGNIYGFEFKTRKRDFIIPSNFKELLCKLIFQTKHQMMLSEKICARDFLCYCRNKDDIMLQNSHGKDEGWHTPQADESISFLKSASVKEEKMEIENADFTSHAKPNITKPILISSNRLKTPNSGSKIRQSSQQSTFYLDRSCKDFLFQAHGDIFQLDDVYTFEIMQKDVTFCVRFLAKGLQQLEGYGPTDALLYRKVIEADSGYHFDTELEIFRWLDVDKSLMRLLAFRPSSNPKDTLLELKNVLTHESTAEKRLLINDINSFRMSPSSVHNSEIRTNLLERYEEESQGKVENNEEPEDAVIFGNMEASNYCIVLDDEEIEKAENMDIADQDEEEPEFCTVYGDDEPEEMLDFEQIFTYHEPREAINYENNRIAQSKLLERVFISRGPIVSVFKAEDTLEFICNLPELTTLDGDPIHPKKILFYNNDSKMLILNQVLDKKIYSLDLQKGLITKEWVLDGYNSILDIDHFTKNGELSHNDTFIGINNKNIFQFDPNNHDGSSISTKKYTSNPKFSCFSTTKDGYFAVGSTSGEIRLFKETGKNAKNLIPGHGDEIIGIDSSRDGSLLAATAENYIMIHRTVVDNSNGYLTSLKKMKLEPIQLSMPEELQKKYELEGMKFTKAKFDNPYNGGEKFLVSTMGRFLVTWTLEEILRGENKPQIHGLKSPILDCCFRDNKDNAIIAILEDEVNYIVI